MDNINVINLDGDWRLINNEKDLNILAQVPGSVYVDLMNNNIIDDPFYAQNESILEWIYESNWIYKKQFEVTAKFLDYSHIKIKFYGIDTFADIFINDNKLGRTNNMFLMYEFDIKDLLKVGINILKIKLYSPTKEAKKLIKKYGYKLINFNKVPGVPYLRKAQYCFGWDVAPNLPDIGLWKNVELIGYHNCKIDTISYFSQLKFNKNPYSIRNNSEFETLEVKKVKLNVQIEIISTLDRWEYSNIILKSELIDPNGKITTQKRNLTDKFLEVRFNISEPYLWWTNDLGAANLYQLNISLEKEGKLIDFYSQKIGLKEFRLIQNLDEYGKSFYFMLNGIPLFAKGSNCIPIDMFIARGKKFGYYEKILKAAAAANTNMLRVWGGGIYEDDIFYELCDELGILVWQDFMFACALYPPFDAFNENVKKEIIYNIKRLRNHPSLALWCGNNEVEMYFDIEAAISQIKEEDQKNLFKSYYIKLFEELIPELVRRLDPHRPYWPSSPSNGSIENSGGFPGSMSQNQGDMHYYGVWHYKEPIEKYKELIPRFMSEFGFVSHPTYKTIKSYCPIDQLKFKSSVMEYHNKDKTGKNRKIMKYIQRRFQFPKDFKSQVILSQIMNGDGLRCGIEYWRKHRLDNRCMGTLYWQTNDCFPGTSWGTLDYYCRWKASHYFIKRIYSPLFINIQNTPDKIELWGINDLKDTRECVLKWKIMDSEGKVFLHNSKQIRLTSCSSQLMESIIKEEIEEGSKDLQNKIIFYSLLGKNDENIFYRNFYLFEAPKFFHLINPHLSYKILKNISFTPESIKIDLEVYSEAIALYVFIDSETADYVASDNYFSMEPKSSYIINLRISNEFSPNMIDNDYIIDYFNKNFKINSLYHLRAGENI